MADHKQQVGELADIMSESGLSEAQLSLGELRIGFKKRSTSRPPSTSESEILDDPHAEYAPVALIPELPKGTPITSPMTGIYYGAPSPGSPPFVREGDAITSGQIIGLIEAMKVFNEIPAPLSGTVLKLTAEGGDLVQPGDVLMTIG